MLVSRVYLHSTQLTRKSKCSCPVSAFRAVARSGWAGPPPTDARSPGLVNPFVPFNWNMAPRSVELGYSLCLSGLRCEQMNFAALAGLARKDMNSIYDCRVIKLNFPRMSLPQCWNPFSHLVINNGHAHLSIAGQQAAPDCDAGPPGHARGEDSDGMPRLGLRQHDVRQLLLHPAGHSPGKSANPPHLARVQLLAGCQWT